MGGGGGYSHNSSHPVIAWFIINTSCAGASFQQINLIFPFRVREKRVSQRITLVNSKIRYISHYTSELDFWCRVCTVSSAKKGSGYSTPNAELCPFLFHLLSLRRGRAGDELDPGEDLALVPRCGEDGLHQEAGEPRRYTDRVLSGRRWAMSLTKMLVKSNTVKNSRSPRVVTYIDKSSSFIQYCTVGLCSVIYVQVIRLCLLPFVRF